jgi:hypothetical protein
VDSVVGSSVVVVVASVVVVVSDVVVVGASVVEVVGSGCAGAIRRSEAWRHSGGITQRG